jgi:hypothetical protein
VSHGRAVSGVEGRDPEAGLEPTFRS